MKYIYTRQGNQLRFKYCPICNKIKENPDFTINIAEGVYFCFSNNIRGRVEDLSKYGFDIGEIPELRGFSRGNKNNRSLRGDNPLNSKDSSLNGDIKKYYKEEGKTSKDFARDIENKDRCLGGEIPQDSKDGSLKNIDLTSIFLARKNNFLNDEWIKYLLSRGISDKYLKKFARLGKSNTMMIPLTNGKKVVGIKYRTIDKKIFSERESQSDYLLGWQLVKDFSYIIIVEGEIDLLSALEVGFESVVSLPFGAGNLKSIENQKDWLSSFEKIIIATDNDTQGKKSKDEIVKILSNVKDKLYEVDMGDFKDFNEILVSDKERLIKIIENPIKINFSEDIKKDLEKKISPFSIGEDGYYYNLTTKITDFLLRITKFSDNYIGGFVITNGREREFFAKKTDLITKNGILENIGYFLGSITIIPNFWSWILEENAEKYIEEIEHYGIINDKYYDPTSPVICSKADLKIKPLEEIKDFTDEEKFWLDENLLNLRKDRNESLLGICWALGRFHIDGAYPILEVSGTTSIGKTEFIEFISRIMFGTRENIKSLATLSNHQIRSFSSCSNITPWAIDEVKITGSRQKEKAEDLYATIRSVYDNKTINQGNITSKLTEFKLCTPLIISGESELSDISVKNRMISIKLTKETNYEKSRQILKNLILIFLHYKVRVHKTLKNTTN